MNLVLFIVITAGCAFVYNSFFEWTLHRFVMHRRFWKLTYAYNTHTRTHHRKFGYDHTYHLIHEEDKSTIPMAWWNGPVLILISLIPVTLVAWFVGIWWIILICAVVTSFYYVAYEYFHWCMHDPKVKRRLIERSWFFYRLNGHHLLHHRYMNRNFNVVLPLADLLLGTLRIRAPWRFPQPRGPSVPDVQPRVMVPRYS
jgi:hypothetical protein